MADELTNGRRFRALTVIDLYTRECLEIVAGQSVKGCDVIAALERLRFARGVPHRIHYDNVKSALGQPLQGAGGRDRVQSRQDRGLTHAVFRTH